MMPHTVSVALATYQGERFVDEQLRSFSQQTRLPDEVIVSDDHSSDATLDIVRSFARTAPFPVTVVQNSRGRGVDRNFENAVRHCSHDIILFSDQDDVWLPEHVAKLVEPFERDPRLTLVVSNSQAVDQQLEPLTFTTMESYRVSPALVRQTNEAEDTQFELYVRHRLFLGHGMAFRAALVPYLVPFTMHCGYDQWVALLSLAAGRMQYVEQPLTFYRIHESQVSDNRAHSLFRIARSHFKSENVRSEDEVAKWLEMKERVREFRDIVPDPRYIQSVIDEKLDFLEKRAAIRKSGLLGRCYASSAQLFRGRYHRFSRGLLAFGRDVCGFN